MRVVHKARRRGTAMIAASIVRIRHTGYLRPDWSEWFNGMAITHDEDSQTTEIVGPVGDQEALGGLLTKVLALGITLISVTPMDGNEAASGA
jgi:hypothetical protein